MKRSTVIFGVCFGLILCAIFGVFWIICRTYQRNKKKIFSKIRTYPSGVKVTKSSGRFPLGVKRIKQQLHWKTKKPTYVDDVTQTKPMERPPLTRENTGSIADSEENSARPTAVMREEELLGVGPLPRDFAAEQALEEEKRRKIGPPDPTCI